MDGTAANGHPDDIYGNAAYSLDTLHKIAAADVGVTVPDYGFSTDFAENTDPVTIHGSPNYLAAFAPLNGLATEESEGANEIAFAPAGFPAGLNNGVFIGFHGQFDQTGDPNPLTGAGNEEHPVVFDSLDSNSYWHFIDNANPGVTIGHLDGVLSTTDSLYLSDLAAGSLFGGPLNTGSIYEITAVPEPASTGMLAVIGLGLMVRRRRAARLRV
jgi:hypothetical protein